MKRVCALSLLALIACTALHAQQPAASTETAGHPFFIKQTWIVGGIGPWDYLTMDPAAERLYIAHGHAVQVVDVTTGSVVGEISGLAEAHSIALDDTGEFGYIADGEAAQVIVFDRRSLQKVTTIEEVPSPRALVFEPQTRLLFAVRTNPTPAAKSPAGPRNSKRPAVRPKTPPEPPPNPMVESPITVIDTDTQKVIGQVLLDGVLGSAQADGRGQIFVDVTDRNGLARFDAQTVATLLHKLQDRATAQPQTESTSSSKQSTAPITLDWTVDHDAAHVRIFWGACPHPAGLAFDNAHSRLFAACSTNLIVMNPENGQALSTLPIGPGVDAIGYDPGRGLIYTANGGGEGSLTIIRQHATDTYSVIQNLPTRQRARTLALNPDTGQVYLVTDLLGVNLSENGSIGTLQTNPVNGSFQVLVVGN